MLRCWKPFTNVRLAHRINNPTETFMHCSQIFASQLQNQQQDHQQQNRQKLTTEESEEKSDHCHQGDVTNYPEILFFHNVEDIVKLKGLSKGIFNF